MGIRFGHSYVTVSQLVNVGRTLVAGFILTPNAGNADVTIWDGLDTVSGRKYGVFKALSNESKVISLPLVETFERGLYIELGSNVLGVTVTWASEQLE